MSVPIAASPGRAGFGPQLSLSYDSGSGNGPFGFGWSLSLPAITRKTDKGLPQYIDAVDLDVGDSDVFLLSGAEDLVPEYRRDLDGSWVAKHPGYTRDPDGSWVRDSSGDLVIHEDELAGHHVRRYRPRIEGLFARIERWTNVETREIHWRSITRDNVTTLYGTDNSSRIFDPADPSQEHPTRIFSWLICASYDDKGNAIRYEYAAENDDNVDFDRVSERNRTRTANRYLKRIYYGNRQPNRSVVNGKWVPTDPAQLPREEWMFEVVFDYGESHYTDPNPETPSDQHKFIRASTSPGQPWSVRPDPFSSYRSTFEVRTYRRCHRVLMFHHIPDLATGEKGYDGLVRTTEFDYDDLDYTQPVTIEDELSHPGSTRFASFIRRITQSGYVRDATQPVVVQNDAHYVTYLKKSLPPLEFEYSQPVIQDAVEEVDPKSLENLPMGIDGFVYQWTDLHGEGIPGILTEQAGGWYYKRNISPIPDKLPDGREQVKARFDPLERVAVWPNLALAGGQAQFMDLAGDGKPDVVVMDGPLPGLYEHDEAEGWQPFRPFTARLNRDMRDPNLKFIDLDGDGHADALITENDAFVWHASLAEAGFGPARRVAQALDEKKGPRIVFADGTQSIYLADMSGDGLTDLVRIRNGEVCHWPNLGYCRFGPRITYGLELFDNPDRFDPKRIRLADIDGSGTTDIIYLHGDGIRLYFNQSGNGFSEPRVLGVFPRVDDLLSIVPVDLLGNGTACLAGSSSLPGDARRPLRYVDLMGGHKPHLLVGIVNNLGAETRIEYAPSTRFYLQDKRNGKPWITRLPFPVHVVERMTSLDKISGNRRVSCFTYRHGYYDGHEREPRGFAFVEQKDTEVFAALTSDGTLSPATNFDAASHVPPVLTRTWFHTGAYLGRERISRLHEDEYYREPGLGVEEARLLLLPDTVLPENLSVEEEREACRALKGMMLRQEVCALDGSADEPHPYTVTEQNFTIRLEQPRGGNRHAVLFTHPREAITYHYEREHNPPDPRVQHALTLEVDPYGNVLKEAAIGYGRRQDSPDVTPLAADRQKQRLIHITCTQNTVTNSFVDDADAYRTPLPADSRTYELRRPQQDTSANGLTKLYRFDDLSQHIDQAGDGKHNIAYEDLHFAKATQAAADNPAEGTHYFRRLIEHVRTLYRPDDLGTTLNDPSALLPLGEVGTRALSGESYRLAFTPGLLAQVFQRNGQPLSPDPASVLGGPGGDRGAYRSSQQLKAAGLFPDTDPDDHWWIPSGRVHLSPDAADTAPDELAYAQQHFFLPHRYRDPFHSGTLSTEGFITYDGYDLLLAETRDAVGNRVTVGERNAAGAITVQGNDYRVLQPTLVSDPNRNRAAVAIDALGMVAGTAVMGKPEENLGDSLDGFVADLTDAMTLDHLADPLAAPHAILRRATTRLVYDLFAYHRTREQAEEQPAAVYTLARETHGADLEPGQSTRIQHSLSYSDAFGREIQKKIQAEPGPVPQRNANGKIITGADGQPQMTANDFNPRWVGSGWTVFNNKGKPVRQYEPFFTDTHRFEFDVRIGVSPVLFYDPVERVVATLHPNHTFEKVVFDPWQQTTYDVNDTIAPRNEQTGDPRTDLDIAGYVAAYFGSLPVGPSVQPWQTWHQQRQTGGLGTEEKTAAEKAASHADTPTTVHLDNLGRPFLTVAHNRVVSTDHPLDGKEDEFTTRVDLDIEGNQRAVRDAIEQNGDALGRVVMRYDYDMLGNRIHQASMEAGERWMLNDATGKPIYAWDSRDHRFRTEYDTLRRPVRTFVTGADPAHPGQELLTDRIVYGEQHPVAELRNLRSKSCLHLDQAGAATTENSDFKGNPLYAARRIAGDYKQAIDWSAVDAVLPANAAATFNPGTLEAAIAPLVEAETYTISTTYDALEPSGDPAHPGQQRRPSRLQRGQPAGAGGLQPARRDGVRSTGLDAVRHRHRLRRQGPAPAHRLRQRRHHLLRLRPAHLPPGTATHPPRRRRLPRRLPAAAPRRLAGLPGAEPPLHLRPGGEHHLHPRRRPADHLLQEPARRAERRLHLRRPLPPDRGHRPRAPGAGRRVADSALLQRRRSRAHPQHGCRRCLLAQRRQGHGELPGALRLRRRRQLPRHGASWLRPVQRLDPQLRLSRTQPARAGQDQQSPDQHHRGHDHRELQRQRRRLRPPRQYAEDAPPAGDGVRLQGSAAHVTAPGGQRGGWGTDLLRLRRRRPTGAQGHRIGNWNAEG